MTFPEPAPSHCALSCMADRQRFIVPSVPHHVTRRENNGRTFSFPARIASATLENAYSMLTHLRVLLGSTVR